MSYFNEVFYPVGDNSVIAKICKKLKLPFPNTKLEIQSFSYWEPSRWNNHPENFESTTSVNSFKHNIKKVSPKKLGDAEVDICSFRWRWSRHL